MLVVRPAFAGLTGAGIFALLVSLAVASRRGLRGAVGSFACVSLGVAVLGVAQVVRADADTVGAMDFATRLSQTAWPLLLWGVLGVFRTATGAPGGRIDRALGLALAACAAYSALSPGGLLYGPIEGLRTSAPLPWGERLQLPVARPDPLAAFSVLTQGGVVLRLAALSALRLRQGGRTHALVMGLATLAYALTVLGGLASSLGWNQGPSIILPAVFLIFALVAWQVVDLQVGWLDERDAALARVRESEGKLSAILEQGQTLAGLLTPDGVLVQCNRRALAMAGVTAEAVLGTRFADGPWWHHAALRARAQAAVERAAAGEDDRFQAERRDADGRAVVVDFSVTPCRDERGAIAWLIVEGRDVSELHRFEQRAREEQRLEVIGQLAGGVAHDFNNQLTGILGAAEAARHEARDPAVRENLDLILEASQRAAALTRQLMLFARRGVARDEVFSLGEVIASACSLFGRTAGPALRVALRLEAGAEDRVRGDPNQLQGALMNLLVNARDAMEGAGTITVATSAGPLAPADQVRSLLPLEPGTYLRLSVTDEGPGVPEALRARIFEPFFTTKAVGRGTGLGLANVLACVRDHGGGVEVSSPPGKGATFTLYLPVSKEQAVAAAAPPPAAAQPAGGALALVVDDEPLVRNTVGRYISKLGFTTELTDGGEQALGRLADLPSPLAFAVVDLHMPGMSGLELAGALRARLPALPIVVSSGNFGEHGLGPLGADPRVRMLPKPFRRDELVEVLVDLQVLARP